MSGTYRYIPDSPPKESWIARNWHPLCGIVYLVICYCWCLGGGRGWSRNALSGEHRTFLHAVCTRCTCSLRPVEILWF